MTRNVPIPPRGATPDGRAIHYLRNTDPGGPRGECLVSRYPRNKGYAYGKIRHKRTRLHRWMLEWFLGRPLGDSLLALHTCHNRACIRPQHLYEGTSADNVRDMLEAGRELKAQPKLRRFSADQVREFRSRWAAGETISALAREGGVSRGPMTRLLYGKTYQEIG